jgi:hypothetical protein
MEFPVRAANLEELQHVSDYRTVRKNLRASGIGSLIFGLYGTVVGINGMQINPLNAVLALLGICLLVEGTYNIVAPMPVLYVVDGVLLILLGVWNMLISILNSSAPGGSPTGTFFPTIAVFQVIWGIQSFARYKRFRAVSLVKPPDVLFKQVDRLAEEIRKAKVKTDPTLFEFVVSSYPQQTWRGRIMDGFAVLVEKTRHETLFLNRDDFMIVPNGKVVLGNSLKALFHFRDRSLKGTVSAESYARYQQWKAAALPTAVPPAGFMTPFDLG